VGALGARAQGAERDAAVPVLGHDGGRDRGRAPARRPAAAGGVSVPPQALLRRKSLTGKTTAS
jgi:hypothetical protein